VEVPFDELEVQGPQGLLRHALVLKWVGLSTSLGNFEAAGWLRSGALSAIRRRS
jgi:hypothetical protein